MNASEELLKCYPGQSARVAPVIFDVCSRDGVPCGLVLQMLAGVVLLMLTACQVQSPRHTPEQRAAHAAWVKGAAKCQQMARRGEDIEAHACMVDLPDDPTADKPLYTPEQRASHYVRRKGMAACDKIQGIFERQICYQEVPADWTVLDPDAMEGVSIHGIDHLADHLSVQDFYVDGANGGRAGPGADAGLCCTDLPNRWRPGVTVEVQWFVQNWRDCIYEEHVRRVPVEPYDHATQLFVHFLANGNVRAVSPVHLPGGPGHINPKYPVQDPIPRKYPWRWYPPKACDGRWIERKAAGNENSAKEAP